MKPFALFLLAMSLGLGLARAAGSRWTFYASYHNSTYNCVAGGIIYSLADGSLMTYDPQTTEVRTYNKGTGLSSVNISFMNYSPSENCLLLTYADGDMDILFPADETLVNMPQYKNSTLTDKTVNDVTVSGRYAYVAQASGITVADLHKCEFSNTYTLSKNVTGACRLGDRIYAFTETGIYVGRTTDNLLDPSSWTLQGTTACHHARVMNGRIYALSASGLLDLGTDAQTATVLDEGTYTWINATSSALLYGNTERAARYTATGGVETLAAANSFQCLSESGGTYWASCGTGGLRPYRNSGTLQPAGSAIIPNSPLHNYCDNMYVAPSGKLWVGGGSMNYVGLNYDATVYSFDGENFVNYPDTLAAITGLANYRNITGVAEDPSDPAHIFATTAETGLYEFRGGNFTAHYDYEENGGHLYSAAPGYGQASRLYVRTGAPAFDADGNLWMTNFEVDTVVQVLRKNGTWKGLYVPSVSKWPTFDHILFDGAGRAWITHRRTTSSHHAGVLCLNYGGTLDDESDDSSMFRYNFTNQDGENVRPTLVSGLALDKDGQVWVATNQGPYVISNPAAFMESDFTFTQIKVPRNDGTNYADYLLSGLTTTAIAVDAANRKWIGTADNGLYLISADNMTQISHFTTSNSPLISNNILSLAVMENEGLLMIGTSEGLMSYRYDKASTEDSFSDDNLKVYPNPVRPTYEGNITVTGLPEGADVRIATAGGQVVVSGTSTGGVFTWNGRNANGRRVATGVYYVLCSTASGSKGAGTRIVFVR